MTTSSHCNTGRTYYPVSISRREHFPSCCSENHNTYAENRKIPPFEKIWYWRHRKKIDHGCTTTNHPT